VPLTVALTTAISAEEADFTQLWRSNACAVIKNFLLCACARPRGRLCAVTADADRLLAAVPPPLPHDLLRRVGNHFHLYLPGTFYCTYMNDQNKNANDIRALHGQ
jgi:hypothetical protein